LARVPRTIRIDLAYDGTGFVGWQRQDNGASVQEALESALAAACGSERVVVEGASRTDSGVHARRQTASAQVESRLDDATLARAVNSRLPWSIAVLRIATVRDDFQARAGARGKHYAYRIRHGERADPIDRAFCAWSRGVPAIPPMREAALLLVGTHDFASFATSGSPRVSTIRTIHGAHVFRRRDLTLFGFCGNGFLYNQVRVMVGTLLLVGHGKLAPARVREILEARDRRLAGPTAPPEGLHLLSVLYDEAPREFAPGESEEFAE
jgi:tRNA pseudouridine38-40 synthase